MDGANDLYSFKKKEIRFFVVKAKTDTSFLLYDDIISPLGQIVEKGNYRNQLFFIGRECERVRSQAERIGYTERELLSFYIALEKCTDNEAASTVFYVKPKTEKGMYLFAGGLPLGKEYEISFQGIVQFVLPSESRKVSLNSGLVYLRNLSEDEYENALGVSSKFDHVTEIFEIPFTIQYNLLDKKVKPYAYIGFGLAYKKETPLPFKPAQEGLQRNFGVTVIGGAGIEGQLSKKISLKLDWRYDLLLHYPVLGIAYRIK